MIIQLKTVNAAGLLACLFNATAKKENDRKISLDEAQGLLKHRGSTEFVTIEGRVLHLDFSNRETLDTSEYDEIYGSGLSSLMLEKCKTDFPIEPPSEPVGVSVVPKEPVQVSIPGSTITVPGINQQSVVGPAEEKPPNSTI